MKELKRNLEIVSDMQNKKRAFQEELNDKEIIIKMSRSTLFFIIIMQLCIVSLFFVLGFIVAWSYNTQQVTPASFAKPTTSYNTQIIEDMEKIPSQ